MLTLLISIIGIVVTLILIIGIHEFGHFLAARLLGIKVLRFSIGFGKALFSRFDKKGTEYVFAAIPLGGYVKMLDATEGAVTQADLPFAFNYQPFYKKCLVVIAGPLANLLLAFFLYWILFIVGFTSIAPVIGQVTPHSIAEKAGLKPSEEIIKIDQIPTSGWMSVIIRTLFRAGDTGTLQMEVKSPNDQTVKVYQLDLRNWKLNDLKPDPLESLGIVPFEPTIPPVIDEIAPDSPAAKSGLKINDKILSLDGKKINDWVALATEIDKRPGEKVNLLVLRANKSVTISVITDYHRDFLLQKHGFLGISPQFTWPKNLLRHNQYGPIEALSHAFQSTYDFVHLNLDIIGKLITGKVSLQSLGGPISIFQSAGSALNQGMASFLSFLAFLSISIGIINIFPIPGLDGGHLLFQSIEAILKRPIPGRVLELCYRLGLIILFLLIFQSIINDVLRLHSS